jgi:hypothetical protein
MRLANEAFDAAVNGGSIWQNRYSFEVCPPSFSRVFGTVSMIPLRSTSRMMRRQWRVVIHALVASALTEDQATVKSSW